MSWNLRKTAETPFNINRIGFFPLYMFCRSFTTVQLCGAPFSHASSLSYVKFELILFQVKRSLALTDGLRTLYLNKYNEGYNFIINRVRKDFGCVPEQVTHNIYTQYTGVNIYRKSQEFASKLARKEINKSLRYSFTVTTQNPDMRKFFQQIRQPLIKGNIKFGEQWRVQCKCMFIYGIQNKLFQALTYIRQQPH